LPPLTFAHQQASMIRLKLCQCWLTGEAKRASPAEHLQLARTRHRRCLRAAALSAGELAKRSLQLDSFPDAAVLSSVLEVEQQLGADVCDRRTLDWFARDRKLDVAKTLAKARTRRRLFTFRAGSAGTRFEPTCSGALRAS
jgi:hypothetical protein